MSEFSKKLQDYISGTAYTECPHPLNRIQECGDKDICSLCGTVVFVASFREVKLIKPTRATRADVRRMWARLWGEVSEPVIPSDWGRMEDGELMDLCEGLHVNQPRVTAGE